MKLSYYKNQDRKRQHRNDEFNCHSEGAEESQRKLLWI